MESPIPNNGTALSWHYCYYPPSTPSASTNYTVQFGMYRAKVTTFGLLKIVDYFPYGNNTVSKVTKTGQDLSNLEGLVCDTLLLSVDEQFSVTEGDIIGVCVHGCITTTDDDRTDTSDSDDRTDTSRDPDDSLTVIAENSQITTSLVYDPDNCMNFNEVAVGCLAYSTVQRHFMHVSLEFRK